MKQLNKLLAVTLLTIMVFSLVGLNNANASIFDWFSDRQNEASDSQSFGFMTSFLSVNDQLINSIGPDQKNLPVIQNSSLVSVVSPLTVKPAKNPKVVIVKTNELTVLVTAYSSTPDQTDSTPFTTAMGTQVRDGIIAANFLPFGTKIKIPEIYGDKIFTVEDRMNRRYWHVIDLWFPDRASALEFGVQRLKIQILES